MQQAYLAGWKESGSAIDVKLFNTYYDLHLAMFCAQMVSRTRVLERWLAKDKPSAATQRRQQEEAALFFRDLARRLRNVLGELGSLIPASRESQQRENRAA